MGARTWSWTEEWVLDDDGSLIKRWRRVLPTIRETFLDSVVYLYASKSDADNGVKTGGSGFLCGIYDPSSRAVQLYVVTNRHVIEAGFSVVRLTGREKTPASSFSRGESKPVVMVVPKTDWAFPAEGDDLAVWPYKPIIASVDEEFAYVALPHYGVTERDLLSSDRLGPGDDCFMVGRFINHDGTQKNLPSVRFGNIAMLPLEKVKVRGVLVDAFLVETRSQAGFSGSPVFVYRQKTSIKVPIREVSAYRAGVREITISGRRAIRDQAAGS